jgi:hypothetical protein
VCRESQYRPGDINKRSAGETIVYREVEPENTIYARTLPAAPPFTDCADDTKAGGHVASRPPDSENKRSDAQRARVRLWRDKGFRDSARNAKRDQIRGRIPSRDRRDGRLPVWEHDRDLVLTPYCVAGTDDDAFAPDDSARRNTAARLNRHD